MKCFDIRAEPKAGNFNSNMLAPTTNRERNYLKAKTQNDVNPWTLIVTDRGKEPRYIERTKKVIKRCHLNDATYLVEMGPAPCNRDVHGMNGGMMQSYAVIRRGTVIVSREVFGGCSAGDELITTKVEIPARSRPAVVTRKPATEYFK